MTEPYIPEVGHRVRGEHKEIRGLAIEGIVTHVNNGHNAWVTFSNQTAGQSRDIAPYTWSRLPDLPEPEPEIVPGRLYVNDQDGTLSVFFARRADVFLLLSPDGGYVHVEEYERAGSLRLFTSADLELLWPREETK